MLLFLSAVVLWVNWRTTITADGWRMIALTMVLGTTARVVESLANAAKLANFQPSMLRLAIINIHFLNKRLSLPQIAIDASGADAYATG